MARNKPDYSGLYMLSGGACSILNEWGLDKTYSLADIDAVFGRGKRGCMIVLIDRGLVSRTGAGRFELTRAGEHASMAEKMAGRRR